MGLIDRYLAYDLSSLSLIQNLTKGYIDLARAKSEALINKFII